VYRLSYTLKVEDSKQAKLGTENKRTSKDEEHKLTNASRVDQSQSRIVNEVLRRPSEVMNVMKAIKKIRKVVDSGDQKYEIVEKVVAILLLESSIFRSSSDF
jgi:hypothetical protein